MSDPLSLPSVVLVTGTGTEVGKTITTAALVAVIRARGTEPCVVKVAQTGVAADEDGDLQTVCRLAGEVPTAEFVRLPDPLAPDTAARRAGVSIPPIAVHARRIGELAEDHPIVLVEGSGGLLVRLDDTESSSQLGQIEAENRSLAARAMTSTHPAPGRSASWRKNPP